MTPKSDLTISKVLRAKSSRITNSNLDHLVKGYFASLDLREEQELIRHLNRAKTWLIDHKERLNFENYDPNLTASEIASRLSEENLLVIQRETEQRFVAGRDVNQIRFENINFSALTQEIARVLNERLEPKRALRLFQSGRNWYPTQGYMGWHTNANVQGFRLYCSHAEKANASYFRYQDPETAEIVTSWDEQGWNFRCFRTDLEPLWHCVYSETDRISFGYGLMFPIEQDS